jgi:hypothetical protein
MGSTQLFLTVTRAGRVQIVPTNVSLKDHKLVDNLAELHEMKEHNCF